MSASPSTGILCSGPSAWAFEELATRLAHALQVPIVSEPADFNYALAHDDASALPDGVSFIPWQGVLSASDKRRLPALFAEARVPTPETLLCESLEAAKQFAQDHSEKEWCLKFPVGTGAAGHRLLTPSTSLPVAWPLPLVLQEFVRMARPTVYRTYCAGGELFGWVARQHPDRANADPWVAHARGARYLNQGALPAEARGAAQRALAATSLLTSFGCVDLVQHADGRWLVLEVGTDGVFSFVDRDLGDTALEREIEQRIAQAFWAWVDARSVSERQVL